MKVLLMAVNAKYIHSNPAIYSLRAYASKYQESIEIAEYTINNQLEDIVADIYGRKPDVLAISCYIWNWNMVQDIIVDFHRIAPDIPIWLGGPEVTYDALSILSKYSELAGIMIGEGEQTFLELVEHYLYGKTDLECIAGLAVCGKFTKERELTDLSTLPFLYHNLNEFKNKIIYYESSRGCPFRCSYCLSSIDKTVRLRDIEIVKQELQFFLNNRVAQVKFIDRTFNCNHEHALQIWKYIKEHDNGVTNFHFEVAADILNEEELNLIHSFRPGLAQMEIGVQSTNLETIHEICRVMDVEKLKKIVASLHKEHNVHIHLDLIAGLPYEDYESFVHSFNEVYIMEPEQLQLGFLKVLKGSYMREKAFEYGINYTFKPPYEVLYSNWISYEEIRKLKAVEEMVELYYNSNQYTKTLPVLLKQFSSPFAMYEALALFYVEKGYSINTPSRAYRYEVLLNFAAKQDAGHKGDYEELLTFDLYLRENLKSRPAFASDQLSYKEVIRDFYEKEADNHKYLKGYEEYDAKQLGRMTHLEAFHYPVLGNKEYNPIKELFVLFDYKMRDPLTQDAKTYLIEM